MGKGTGKVTGARDQADCIVAANGCAILFCDESHLASLLRGARVEALRALRSDEQIVAHFPLLHGTYRIVVRATAPDGGKVREGALQLPTGQLAAWSDDRGGRVVPIMPVAAGRYGYALDWSTSAEESHWEIEAVEKYPAGDGPDGVLAIWRIE